MSKGDLKFEIAERKWPARILQACGALNLMYGVSGLCLIGLKVYFVQTVYPPNTPDKPYWRDFFFAMSSLNVVFLAVLMTAGVGLLRLRMKAVTLCNYLFPIEVFYYIGMGFFYDTIPLPRVMAMSLTAAMRVGDEGILPQIVTGYPILALFALNYARPRYLYGPPRILRGPPPVARAPAPHKPAAPPPKRRGAPS